MYNKSKTIISLLLMVFFRNTKSYFIKSNSARFKRTPIQKQKKVNTILNNPIFLSLLLVNVREHFITIVFNLILVCFK